MCRTDRGLDGIEKAATMTAVCSSSCGAVFEGGIADHAFIDERFLLLSVEKRLVSHRGFLSAAAYSGAAEKPKENAS